MMYQFSDEQIEQLRRNIEQLEAVLDQRNVYVEHLEAEIKRLVVEIQQLKDDRASDQQRIFHLEGVIDRYEKKRISGLGGIGSPA